MNEVKGKEEFKVSLLGHAATCAKNWILFVRFLIINLTAVPSARM